jgi:hypothetical protein
MACLLGCLGLAFPRLVLVVLWITDYLDTAYESVAWPLLGFLFLPLTTITYAWIINSNGEVAGLYTVAVTLAVLADLGVLGGSRGSVSRA